MNIEKSLTPLTKTELMEINGGGFAYDLGRAIRFVIVSAINGGPASPSGHIMAVADAAANSVKNKS